MATTQTPAVSPIANLALRHYNDLRSSGLTDDTIERSGIYSADRFKLSDILGRSIQTGGYVLPYPGCEPFARVKLDPAPSGDSSRRYSSPSREHNPTGNRLYLPPNLPAETLSDPKVPLIITEGEKKALMANQEGFACIGLAGVTCWVTKEPSKRRSVPLRDSGG